MDVTGAQPVKTVLLVTPSNDASDPAWAFVPRHIEAMEAVCERVIVITPDDGPLESSSADSRLALEDVYEGRDRETVIVVLDDISLLAQVRSEFGDRVPLLWWSSQVPTAKVIAAAARWADGMAALGEPDGGTGSVPLWTVGAGLELQLDVPAAPPRPPLQLLALGRTAPSKGLTTMVRAVASARSNGIDTRLRIVGPATSAVEHSYRHALGELIGDIALTSVVTIHDAIPPAEAPAAIAGAHALIDASVDGDLRHASLEAFAAGRPVLTSNERLLRLLPAAELALDFEPGDPAQLAQRISHLAELWPVNLTTLAGAVHTSLAAAHERSSLVPQWARAIEEVHALATLRRATAAPEPSMNGDAENDADISPFADTEATRFSLPTEEIALEPAGTVASFLDAWTHRDPERALTSCAPGALRFGTATDGTSAGVALTDYLYWAARTADDLVTAIEDVDVIDERTVVTVRRDRWTIGNDELVVDVRSLFELEEGLITSWWETDLRPTPPQFVTSTDAAASFPAAPVAAAAVAAPVEHATPTTVVAPSLPAAGEAVRNLEEELARAEEQSHHWRRQALIWRERALEARALGEAYKSNVDDLRVIVEVLKRQSPLPESPPANPADALRAYGTTADEGGPDSISWTLEDPGAPTEDDGPAQAPATDDAVAPDSGGTADEGPAPAPVTDPVASEPAVSPPASPAVDPPRPAVAPNRTTTRSSDPPAAQVAPATPTRRPPPETIVEKSTRLARQFARSFGKR